jgi:hypothetical protein
MVFSESSFHDIRSVSSTDISESSEITPSVSPSEVLADWVIPVVVVIGLLVVLFMILLFYMVFCRSRSRKTMGMTDTIDFEVDGSLTDHLNTIETSTGSQKDTNESDEDSSSGSHFEPNFEPDFEELPVWH